MMKTINYASLRHLVLGVTPEPIPVDSSSEGAVRVTCGPHTFAMLLGANLPLSHFFSPPRSFDCPHEIARIGPCQVFTADESDLDPRCFAMLSYGVSPDPDVIVRVYTTV